MRLTRAQALERFGFREDLPVISITGGSQGSRAINNLVEKALDPLFSGTNLQVVWQTGSKSYEELKPLESRYPSLRIYPFMQDMGAVYSASDLLVSRAGALALAEITRCGKPSVLIPFPGAAAGHQTTNARVLEVAGAAVVLNENDLTPSLFVNMVKGLLSDPVRLEKMGTAAGSLSVPGASKRIAQEIFSLVAP